MEPEILLPCSQGSTTGLWRLESFKKRRDFFRKVLALNFFISYTIFIWIGAFLMPIAWRPERFTQYRTTCSEYESGVWRTKDVLSGPDRRKSTVSSESSAALGWLFDYFTMFYQLLRLCSIAWGMVMWLWLDTSLVTWKEASWPILRHCSIASDLNWKEFSYTVFIIVDIWDDIRTRDLPVTEGEC
jgi:hypothetical protein